MIQNVKFVVLVFASVFFARAICEADEPLATFAVVSNPYITTLPPAEIKDESGRVRDFLAKTGPQSMQRTTKLVNAIRPDALIVLGSQTWSGSKDDLAAIRMHLDKVKVPVYVTPGHRDRLSGSLEEFRRVFGEHVVDDRVKLTKDVALAFAGDLDRDPDAATRRLDKQLAECASAKAVLLFSGLDRSTPRTKLTPAHETFWKLVDRRKIAIRFDPTRYGHQLKYANTLPGWSVPSVAWSARGAITLVRVFEDRIDVGQVVDPQRSGYRLTVPNPVAVSRMRRAADDPTGCPSYSRDLAAKPQYTFALVSDPQFDRQANREYLIQKARAAIADLNRLKPAMVFVAGDLVNNNLPEEWELFNRVFADLKIPKHVVPGNHDVLFNYDFVERSYASAPERNPAYAAIVKKALSAAEKEGFRGPAALYEKYTGSKPRQLIEHQNSAFITVPFLTTRADAEQIRYLREQLQRVKDKRHVFVVAHYPALPAFGNNIQPQLGGSDVLALLHEHRVTGYLFGHRHRNGYRFHERTAHVLADNMLTLHLVHVFEDQLVIGRKRVGSPLYEKMIVPASR